MCRSPSLGFAALAASLTLSGCATAIGEPPEAGPDAAVEDDSKADDPVTIDAAPPSPEPTPVTLSHSTSTDIQEDQSLRCNDDNGTTDRGDDDHADNSYYRVFDLAALGIEGELAIASVTVGIQEASSRGEGSQPASVRLYTLDGALRVENLTQIGGADIEVADQVLSLLEIPVTATAPAGSVVVVEFFTPDGVGSDDSLWVGANSAGQSAPSYILARTCDFQQPVDVAALSVDGFDTSQVHYVLSVSGTVAP